MMFPIHLEPTSFKKDIKPDDPPQDVDKPHLSVSTSTTTNLNETCSLDASCDHLLHLDSPSHSSEPQYTSSVESVEIEFIHESEEHLENNRPSPKDVFSSQHNNDLFLLSQEIDTPSDNPNHQDTHVCENQDDILIHATNLSHTFALPQFMAQHNCEDLKPTDTPSKASLDHTFNPKCAHSLMATQCNQSQYLTLMKQICTHNHLQVRLVKPTSPTLWCPHTHQILQVLLPEEFIPPSLHTLCNLKPTMFHLGDDYLCPTKILLPPGDNVTENDVQLTFKAPC